jgi:hypothetical protein
MSGRSGHVGWIEPDAATIQLGIGECQNGRRMAPEVYECKPESDDQMNCFLDGSFKLVLHRE